MISEQLSVMQKSSLETLFNLSDKALTSAEKITELNMQAAKALLSEAHETMQAAFSAKDLKQIMALQSDWLKSAGEKALAYRDHLKEIATSSSAEFTQAAEAGAKETQEKILAAAHAAAKDAPAGAKAVEMLKSGFDSANSAYDGMQKAAKQASDTAEANVNTATESATKSAQAMVNKAKRVEA